MSISQYRSRKKVSGGLYRSYRGKRKYELGREPSLTTVGKQKPKYVRTQGNNRKIRLLQAEFANVVDRSNKIQKVKVKSVIDNAANRFFIRRNIITKGAIIDTDLGKAKVTNRPGQDGVVNAVLV